MVAFVSQPEGQVPILTKLVATKNGTLNSINDNVWNLIRKDHKRLIWTGRADDENRAWHYERADGSFTRNGRSLFYYGIQDVTEVERTLREIESSGRIERAYLPLHATRPASAGVGAAGARGLHTSARAAAAAASPFAGVNAQRRGYATAIEKTAPIPGSTTEKKRIALIGARGYTGQSLISLIDKHPHLSLSHVSSRELAGKKLEGYTKENVAYSNIGVEDLRKLEAGKGNEAPPDAYVMALPNGVCKPFVDAVLAGSKERAGKQTGKIVDLSADYRFEKEWTYGLPGAL